MLAFTKSKTARHLHLAINVNRRRITNSFFKTERDRIGPLNRNARPETVMMLYGNLSCSLLERERPTVRQTMGLPQRFAMALNQNFTATLEFELSSPI